MVNNSNMIITNSNKLQVLYFSTKQSTFNDVHNNIKEILCFIGKAFLHEWQCHYILRHRKLTSFGSAS